MKLSAFYQAAVKFGAGCDPRKDKKQKTVFPDSAILYGKPDVEVGKILIGIDAEVPELLLGDKIRQAQGLDLVLSHHPEGSAYAALHRVMRLQIDVLVKAGVKEAVAKELLEERMREVERGVMPNNHMRCVDAARLLDLPYMCLHTPADNQVADFLTRLFAQIKPKTPQDVVKLLLEVPEYKLAAKEVNNGPKIILGNPRRSCGKILLEMTGGTEGSRDVYDKLSKSGIRTLVCMHLSEGHLKKVKDANLNVVIAGHISSDTLGLNLLLDKIERQAKQKFQVLNCSGFRRISRN